MANHSEILWSSKVRERERVRVGGGQDGWYKGRGVFEWYLI